MNSPVASALNGVPERYRYARVVIGRKSVSASDSSPRSSLTLSRSLAYSSFVSFLATASSSPSNSSLAVSRHAPKWYSSKTTRSQLISCSQVFFGLMLPAASRPSRSWNEPK